MNETLIFVDEWFVHKLSKYFDDAQLIKLENVGNDN